MHVIDVICLLCACIHAQIHVVDLLGRVCIYIDICLMAIIMIGDVDDFILHSIIY